ncbi:Alanine--tRNA ligase, mitochondrial [Gossypium arboreum]|uniref:Alanine--tRNA ligase, mitochondrial n=1 Tax=Gossypium arboreum TaxID=29729 RepID=A0A0B0NAT3_GOSAR|nr:Alanine--tRNA ligase, mitochondrial [Gossypium arboreum]
MGISHARAHLTTLTTGMAHGRVPAEPKFSLVRKRPILRALRHSKAYLNT